MGLNRKLESLGETSVEALSQFSLWNVHLRYLGSSSIFTFLRKLFILEQFQIYRKIAKVVWRIPTCSVSPAIDISIAQLYHISIMWCQRYMLSTHHVTAGGHLPQGAEVAFASFLHCTVTLFLYFLPLLLGKKPWHGSHLGSEERCSTSWRGQFVHKVEFFFTARLSALSHSFISLFAMAIGVMDIFRILWVMIQYYALYFVAQTARVGHLELFLLTECPFCILVLTFWSCRMLQSLLVCSRLSPESVTSPGSPGSVCCLMVLESTIWAPLSLVVTGPSQLPEQATMCDIH